MNHGLFHHVGDLVRFIFRRDRIRMIIWILAIAITVVIIPPTYANLYPTAADRAGIATALKNPAMVAMVGPGYSLDNITIGALTGSEMLLFAAIAAAIMNIFLVIRHTRKDEEGGRIEVIRSLPVGRLSNLLSALLSAIIINIALAVITALGLIATGVASITVSGSFSFGIALGAIGLFFAGIAAIFCQLSDSSLGAVGYSFMFLGVAYFVRAIGDVSNETLSMFSPLGWLVQVQPYVSNNWWPIALNLLGFIILALLALYLNAIRDMGAGFVRQRKGRKSASGMLHGTFGLSLRLVRVSMISWLIGMAVLGASYGSVFGDVDTFFSENEMMKQMMSVAGGDSPVEMYTSMLMTIMAIACTIPGIILMLRLRGEEKRGRTEHILARAVSREKLFASYLIPAIIASTLIHFFSILAMWGAGYASMNGALSLENMLKAGMIYLPAIYVLIALTAFVIGFLPKFTSFIWVYLTAAFFVVYLGGLLQMPEWSIKLFPFGNIPNLPMEEIHWPTTGILILIAAALTVAGFIGFRRRDMVPE